MLRVPITKLVEPPKKIGNVLLQYADEYWKEGEGGGCVLFFLW